MHPLPDTRIRAHEGRRHAAGTRRDPQASGRAAPLRAVMPTGSRTLATDVFEQIRADILYCRVDPGTRLLFTPLRKRYRASLSPLREALMRLAVEGLVQWIDLKAFRVAPMSREELVDITNTLLELEALVIRLAIEKGNQSWDAGIRARLQRLGSRDHISDDGREWEASETLFRDALYAACGSPWLMLLCRQFFDRFSRYRYLHAKQTKSTRVVASVDENIMHAVVARDVDAAIRLLKQNRKMIVETILAQWRSPIRRA